MEKPKVFIERAAPLTKEGIRAVCGTEKEYKIYVKRLMTKVAKGEVSEKEADILIKSKKVSQKRPVGQIKGNIQKRAIKAGGNKKSHKNT